MPRRGGKSMRVPRLAAAAAALAIVLPTSSASALDHTIPAAKLLLKRSASGKEKLVLISKERTFPIGAVGSPDDPSIAGVHIDLFSPNGPAQASFDIPAGVGNPGWKLN